MRKRRPEFESSAPDQTAGIPKIVCRMTGTRYSRSVVDRVWAAPVAYTFVGCRWDNRARQAVMKRGAARGEGEAKHLGDVVNCMTHLQTETGCVRGSNSRQKQNKGALIRHWPAGVSPQTTIPPNTRRKKSKKQETRAAHACNTGETASSARARPTNARAGDASQRVSHASQRTYTRSKSVTEKIQAPTPHQAESRQLLSPALLLHCPPQQVQAICPPRLPKNKLRPWRPLATGGPSAAAERSQLLLRH